MDLKSPSNYPLYLVPTPTPPQTTLVLRETYNSRSWFSCLLLEGLSVLPTYTSYSVTTPLGRADRPEGPSRSHFLVQNSRVAGHSEKKVETL